MKKKICVVTATRAEYGLLSGLLKEISKSETFLLQMIVTGMHLSPEFGFTYREIENDGYKINDKVEALLSSDSAVGVAKSMGLTSIGFAEALDKLRPDLIIILGDRFEMLAVAQVALILQIPIAHIAGGDVTEGAYDDAIRHSISKMSNLHFVTNEIAKKRLIQLGEDPQTVFNVGSLGIDNIKNTELLSLKELSKLMNFNFLKKNILITLHPVTVETSYTKKYAQILLEALDEIKILFDIGFIFTKANADNGGREINYLFENYCKDNKNAKIYDSLGKIKYLSCLHYIDAVVGNSSSGLYEVPSFNKATINIGNRQLGRLKASSVIDVDFEKNQIKNAIIKALNKNIATENPYGEGETAYKIIDILTNVEWKKTKRFFDIEGIDS
ncbi:UDP-N-acetylglucosamine 2-epimerase [Lysinibacillus sp. NPDC093216]|uniref:UDP-N-acetylglucosamine 2-epimerase n=1 Tax=Lysinibacillus sp. NPDC093216 TaxID=3390576 RepID=UPI003D064FF7